MREKALNFEREYLWKEIEEWEEKRGQHILDEYEKQKREWFEERLKEGI